MFTRQQGAASPKTAIFVAYMSVFKWMKLQCEHGDTTDCFIYVLEIFFYTVSIYSVWSEETKFNRMFLFAIRIKQTKSYSQSQVLYSRRECWYREEYKEHYYATFQQSEYCYVSNNKVILTSLILQLCSVQEIFVGDQSTKNNTVREFGKYVLLHCDKMLVEI